MNKEGLCCLGRCEASGQHGTWYQVATGTNKRTDNLVMFLSTQATSMALIQRGGGEGNEEGAGHN